MVTPRRQTKEYINLESVLGIPRTDLIQSNQGGDPKLQGTWVHIKIAAVAYITNIFHR